LLGALNPALYTVSYYYNSTDAETGNNAVSAPANYANINAGTDLVWARVQENANPSNFGTTSFEVIVNPRPANPNIAPIVVYGTAGTGTVELSYIGEQILNNYESTVSIHFYATEADAFGGGGAALPGVYTTSSGTLWMRLQDEVTGCTSVYSFTVTVTSINMGDPVDLSECDLNNDHFAIFDLTQNNMFVIGDNNPALYTITYHETLYSAEVNSDTQISESNLTNYQNIDPDHQALFVRMVEIASGDFAVKSFYLNVMYVPETGTPDALGTIDANGDGQETFDLTTALPQILGDLPVDDFDVTFYTTQAGAVNGAPQISDPTSYVSATATVYSRVQNAAGCYSIDEVELVVLPSDYTTPAPTGETTFAYEGSATLGDIELDGENILWYATDGQTPPPSTQDEATLPLSTVLVNGTTYYASQTLYGIESTERLPVQAYSIIMGTVKNNFAALAYYPNPVKGVFTIANGAAISNVEVINTLGQRVYSAAVNNTTATINFEGLKSGIYFVKVQSGTAAQTIKVVKE
jgi:hypothetical protein